MMNSMRMRGKARFRAIDQGILSFIQGDVTIVRGDSGAQVAATLNAPLLAGDYITTAGGSRAEVQFDGISMLRLAQDTQVRFVNLDPSAREIQLASGTVVLAELDGPDGNPQIDTPSVSIQPDRSGDYRVSVLGNGQTLVTVRAGSATVATQNGTQTLEPGTTLVAYGPYQNPTISLQAAIAFDDFDSFNASRDRYEIAAMNGNPYLAPPLAGYTNFSQYGQWYNVPGYGEAWAPYGQSNGWTPYANGQWVWEPGYGYTWVGNEPWGYAPYHYGYWFYAPSYSEWMWQPPPYQEQTSTQTLLSAWLPALVGFFLTGGNPGGFSGGYNPAMPYGYANVGWVPLAPGEPYQPWFGLSAAPPPTTLANVTDITNVYRNIRYIRVVRVIPVNRFRSGEFAHPVLLPVRQLTRVAAILGALPIIPTRALLRPSNRIALHRVTISPRFAQAHLQARFAERAPAIARARFDRQAAAIRQAIAKPRVVPAGQFHAAAPRAVPVYRPAAVRRAPLAPPATVERPARAAFPGATARPRPRATMRPAFPGATPRPAVRRELAPAAPAASAPVAPERYRRPRAERTHKPKAHPTAQPTG